MKISFKKTDVTVSFFLAAFIAFSLLSEAGKNIVFALTAAFLHESGHFLVMCIMKNRPEKLVLNAAGVEMSNRDGIKLSFQQEIFAAFAGPAINFLTALLLLTIYNFFPRDYLVFNAGTNICLGIFNLLPIETLDGGRILYFALAIRYDLPKAEKCVHTVSLILTVVLLVFGIFLFFRTKRNLSLLITSLYLVMILLNEYF